MILFLILLFRLYLLWELSLIHFLQFAQGLLYLFTVFLSRTLFALVFRHGLEGPLKFIFVHLFIEWSGSEGSGTGGKNRFIILLKLGDRALSLMTIFKLPLFNPFNFLVVFLFFHDLWLFVYLKQMLILPFNGLFQLLVLFMHFGHDIFIFLHAQVTLIVLLALELLQISVFSPFH